MLTIELEPVELYDEDANRFINIPGGIAKMEHSLAAIAEWEEIYNKPFFGSKKTKEEINHYLYCTVINKEDVDRRSFDYLSNTNLSKINAYFDKPHTATKFYSVKESTGEGTSSELTTAETFYYCMSELNIDYSAQYWNLDRLQTLIRFITQKRNADDKKNKLSREETLAYYKEQNRRRREELKREMENNQNGSI